MNGSTVKFARGASILSGKVYFTRHLDLLILQNLNQSPIESKVKQIVTRVAKALKVVTVVPFA